MMIEQITDHVERARARLRQQYKKKQRLAALLEALTQEAQTLEEVLHGMYTNRSIYNAEGKVLDVWGLILDEERLGLQDQQFRIKLLAKIAQNVSQGTHGDVVRVYKLLTQAATVRIEPIYPASVILTATNVNLVGTPDEVKAALLDSVPAGVSVEIFGTSGPNPFVFAGHPNPNGRGFGDLNNHGLGGTFATII